MAETAVKPETEANVLESFSTCYICLDQLTSSKCLPCTHMFCRDCLKQYIEKQQQDLPEGSSLSAFPCPVCRQNTLPTVAEDKFLDWADGYPSSDLVSSIEESRALRGGRKACKFCEVKSESFVNSDLWCKNCNVFYCNSCRWMHDALHDGHVVLPVTEIKENPFSTIRHTALCGQHVEIPRMFCVDHQQVACQICMTTCHRKCKDILVTKDVAMAIKQNKEIETLLGELEVPLADMSGLTGTVKGHFDIQDSDRFAAEDHLGTIMEEVKEHFLEKISKLYKEGKEKNTLKLNRCKQLEFALTHLRSSLLGALKVGDDADVVMMKTRGKSQLQKYCSEIHNEFKQNEIKRLAVAPEFITHLKRIEIAKNTIDHYNQSAPLTNRTSYPLNCKLQQSFDVSLPSDAKTCNITGVLFYEKNRIMVVDSGNFTVKLFTETGEPLSYMSMPEHEVWGLCQMGPLSFAVSCGSSGKILMVDVDTDKLVLKNSVNVDSHVYGIAYTGTSLVVTDGGSPSMIREHSADGKELRSTKTLNKVKHIVTSPNSGKLVVGRGSDVSSKSDRSEGETLLMAYEDLQPQSEKPLLACCWAGCYSDRLASDSFRSIQGLAVDEQGNVLFVGIGGDSVTKVTMISTNGVKRNILEGIKSPYAVSLYHSSFVVSESGSSTLTRYSMF